MMLQIRNSFIHVSTDDGWSLLMLLKDPWLTGVQTVCEGGGLCCQPNYRVFWHWPTCQWSGNIIHIAVMSIRWVAAPQFRAISPPLAHLIDTYLVILCIKTEPTPLSTIQIFEISEICTAWYVMCISNWSVSMYLLYFVLLYDFVWIIPT